MYFDFIKLCIFLLAILLVTISFPLIFNNVQGDVCKTHLEMNRIICSYSFVNIMSLSKKTTIGYQSMLNFFNILITLVLVEMFKIR